MNPVRDMTSLEKELINSKKSSDSEILKVETYRFTVTERLCEYLDEYREFLKKSTTLLNNYSEQVVKTKLKAKKQVEELLNVALEDEIELTQSQIKKYPLFEISIEETLKKEKTSVPLIIQHMVTYLDCYALNQMGIFRISAHKESVQELINKIESGKIIDLREVKNPHIMCTIFKQYLRTLPNTLTMYEKFQDWLNPLKQTIPILKNQDNLKTSSEDQNNENEEEKFQFDSKVIESYKVLVESLPTPYANSLDFLISFCTRVISHSDQNLMNITNLASLIAPNILRRLEDPSILDYNFLEDIRISNRVVECLIQNYENIFLNIDYDLKKHGILDFETLSVKYPLCADNKELLHLVSTNNEENHSEKSVYTNSSDLSSIREESRFLIAEASTEGIKNEIPKVKKVKKKKAQEKARQINSSFESNLAVETILKPSGRVKKHEKSASKSKASPSDLFETPPKIKPEPVSITPKLPNEPEIAINFESRNRFNSVSKARRHSINAVIEDEGLDPTKANYGTIETPSENKYEEQLTQLNLNALLDDSTPTSTIRITQRNSKPFSKSNEQSTSPLRTGRIRLTNINSLERKNKDRSIVLKAVKIENSQEFNESMNSNFNQDSKNAFIVLGYLSSNVIKVQEAGNGGIDNLFSLFNDGEIQYALLRLHILEDENTLLRDVFIQWNGSNVSSFEKAVKSSHVGEIKELLSPHSTEVSVNSRTGFSLQRLLEASHPTSTSHLID